MSGPVEPTSAPVESGDARILDLGYRSFAGERLGVSWSVRSLVIHTIRRGLGLKRPVRHKIAPLLAIGFAFLPAIAMAGFAAFIGAEIARELVSYGEYIGIVGFAVFLYVAAVTPGVLTTDRTNGMLALYLASPLTRTTYVLARAIGIFLVLLIATAGPIVFLILAYRLSGASGDTWLDSAAVLGKGILAGSITAAFYTGLSMFVASFPRRWGIASIAIVGVVLIPVIVVGALSENLSISDRIGLAAPAQVVGEAWQRILGDPPPDFPPLDVLGSPQVVIAAVVYAVAALAATWWRYQRIEVER